MTSTNSVAHLTSASTSRRGVTLFVPHYVYYNEFTLLLMKVSGKKRGFDGCMAWWNPSCRLWSTSTQGYAIRPRALTQVKVTGDGSAQMDNVSGRVTEPRYLFFYSMKEFQLELIQWNQTQAGGGCVCVWVGGGCFTSALGTSCSTECQGKLCGGTGSELLKQSSADKPCILSPRERARA